ncbi:unnamed protein product [Rhizopus microsporus]
MSATPMDIDSPVDDVKGKTKESGEKPRFEVKKWNAVALWAWDIVVDNCAICRNHIMDLCIECQANEHWLLLKNAQLHGVFVITLFTFIAYRVG